MTTTVRVYPGYLLSESRRVVGITEDGVFVSIKGDDIQPISGGGPHPLATVAGLEMLTIWLRVDADWSALTKAQQRCLTDPATRATRPWAALVAKGLADADGLTASGMFLRLAHERITR